MPPKSEKFDPKIFDPIDPVIRRVYSVLRKDDGGWRLNPPSKFHEGHFFGAVERTSNGRHEKLGSYEEAYLYQVQSNGQKRMVRRYTKEQLMAAVTAGKMPWQTEERGEDVSGVIGQIFGTWGHGPRKAVFLKDLTRQEIGEMERFVGEHDPEAVGRAALYINQYTQNNHTVTRDAPEPDRKVMHDLGQPTRLPRDLFRGIVVPPDHRLAQVPVGQTVDLQMLHPVSSWSENRQVAEHAAAMAASKGRSNGGTEQVIVRLEDGSGVRIVFATHGVYPGWFEKLTYWIGKGSGQPVRARYNEWVLRVERARVRVIQSS